MRAIVAIIALAVAIPFADVGTSVAQPADTILVNGKILALDKRSSVVQAMAIRGDSIIATGATDDIVKEAGAGTRVIDLGGRTVIPGLIDSHIHAIRAGLKFLTEVSWIGATSIAEAMERIRVAAIYARPGTWIVVGGGWTPNQFAEGRRPTQAELAAAAPDHPVYVQLFYRAVLLTPSGQQASAFTPRAICRPGPSSITPTMLKRAGGSAATRLPSRDSTHDCRRHRLTRALRGRAAFCTS
jgi:hypothetical protein